MVGLLYTALSIFFLLVIKFDITKCQFMGRWVLYINLKLKEKKKAQRIVFKTELYRIIEYIKNEKLLYINALALRRNFP